MKIGDVISGYQGIDEGDRIPKQPAGNSVSSFGGILTDLISDVNTMQNEASDAVKRFTVGEITDLHEVMVATEKAKTSLDLLMEIRNKAVDAYRELMRTSV